jgi:hypothetical protein
MGVVSSPNKGGRREKMRKVENELYKRVSKKTARRVYNEGGVVMIVAHRLNPWSIFQPAITILQDEHTFDWWVNDYQWYNCNYETGYYCAYYIKKAIEKGSNNDEKS